MQTIATSPNLSPTSLIIGHDNSHVNSSYSSLPHLPNPIPMPHTPHTPQQISSSQIATRRTVYGLGYTGSTITASPVVLTPPISLNPPEEWNDLPLTIIIKLLANMRKNGITIFPKSYQRDRRIEWKDFTVNQQEKIIIGWNKLTPTEKLDVLNEVRERCPLKGSIKYATNINRQEVALASPLPEPVSQEPFEISPSSSTIIPAKRSRIEAENRMEAEAAENIIVIDENDETSKEIDNALRDISFPTASERIELMKIGTSLLLGAAKEVDDPEIKKRKLDLVEKIALDIIKKGMGA